MSGAAWVVVLLVGVILFFVVVSDITNAVQHLLPWATL